MTTITDRIRDPVMRFIYSVAIGVGLIVLVLFILHWVESTDQQINPDQPRLGELLTVPLGWRVVTYHANTAQFICVSQDGLQYRICYPQVAGE